MFVNKWLLLAFCVSTAMLARALWKFAETFDATLIYFNSEDLGQCQLEVLPEPEMDDLSDARANWKEMYAWCNNFVWKADPDASLLQNMYVWQNDDTVLKCEQVRECDRHKLLCMCGFLALLAVNLVVDYLVMVDEWFEREGHRLVSNLSAPELMLRPRTGRRRSSDTSLARAEREARTYVVD